jgi:hypothetical protein
MKGLFLASIIIVVGVAALIITANSSSSSVDAQESDLQSLILDLQHKSTLREEFIFSIVLAHPPNSQFLEATIGSDDGFVISDIGKDYVCVVRVAGAALPNTCIPFSNISNINYLEN